jgi:hypothetical protein
MLPHKTKQFFFVLVKLSIVVGAFYFIYQKLTNNSKLSFTEFIEFTSENGGFSLKIIAFLIVLSGFNWFLEILKWKILASTLQKINFKQATNQTLGSLTASIITPNRIGEYGAKAMYFKKELRKRIMLANLIGNLQQMSITLLLGAVGLYFFISKYNLNHQHHITFLIVASLFTILLLVFILRNNKLNFKGFSFEKLIAFFLNFPKKNLITSFLFSFLRYATFSFQFFFLLQCFEVEITYFNSMVFITSMYLLASILPTISVFDFVIKGSVAVYLFSNLEINQLIILSITTIMWLLNFVLPSLFGCYFVLRFKLPKPQTTA